jgi:crotonobetainyl-CoA:carnitine CoA-transferase CaiB-like acyl-CoA transferase
LKITRHAPRLGEHSLAVFKEAGIPAAEVDALLKSGATIDGEATGQAAAAAS